MKLSDPYGSAPSKAPFAESVSTGMPWHNLPLRRNYTIGQLLDQTIARCGENDALVLPDRDFRLNWYELGREVDLVAKGLMALGVKRGERIALIATNIPHWVVLMLAVAKIGAVLLPLNTHYKKKGIDFALRHSGAENLFVSDGFREESYIDDLYELMTELKYGLRHELHPRNYPNLKRVFYLGGVKHKGMFSLDELKDLAVMVPDAAYFERQAKCRPDDVVNMQYTSGTTNLPKAVLLTHKGIVNNSFWSGACQNFTSRDRLCIPVPLFHCFGCVLGVVGSVNHGVTMVLVERFNPVEVIKAIHKERCTAVFGVPTMYIAMLDHPELAKYDLSSLRTGVMSGSVCPVHRMEQAHRYMPEITIPYGLTEGGPVMTMTRYFEESVHRKCETVGQALPGMEVAVIDPETKELAPIGQEGELCCRGLYMKRYYNMPEATAECIDENGWLHSGDLGKMDADGYFYITGRLKDMIIRGGENISPKEVEQYIGSLPEVKDVAVVGCPSKLYGEQPAAFVQLQEGASLTGEDITNALKPLISWFKIPKYYEFVADYPKTASGKIQKYRLRERARDLWPDA